MPGPVGIISFTPQNDIERALSCMIVSVLSRDRFRTAL
jgi:hypothetical protein